MKTAFRRRAFMAWLLVIPLTFGLKYYRGPGEWWVNNWGSSFGYEIFFMLLVFMLVPRRGAIASIAVAVCLATCALEFMQLWKPSFLETMRQHFIGRALLGNTFAWTDLPAYPAGCLLGWFTLRWLTHRVEPKSPMSDSTASRS